MFFLMEAVDPLSLVLYSVQLLFSLLSCDCFLQGTNPWPKVPQNSDCFCVVFWKTEEKVSLKAQRAIAFYDFSCPLSMTVQNY